MSFTKLITAATLAGALTLAMSGQALAAEMSQEQELKTNSKVEVNCTAGAYGQDSTCTAKAESEASGKQTQKIVYRADGTPVVVHDVVNTGLDLPVMLTVAGTIVSGAAAAVIRLKNHVA